VKLTISRGIRLTTAALICSTLFAQHPLVLENSTSVLKFRVTFADPTKGYELEDQLFTIGLPTDELPRLSITPIRTTPLSDKPDVSPFFSPAIGYGKWERLERYRNLNVGIMRLSPTVSNDAVTAALELEVTIRFPGSSQNRPALARSEELLYRHRILNWSSAKSWVARKVPTRRLDRRTDLTGDWYKITVPADGIYGIVGTALSEAGMDIAAVNPDALRMFTNPRGGRPLKDSVGQPIPENLTEVAIRVDGGGDGTIHEEDEVVFYGRGPRGFDTLENGTVTYNQNPYTDLNVYWLNVPLDSETEGKRIETVNEEFSEPVVIEYGMAYNHAENDEINPFESGLLWVGPGVTRQQTVSAPIQLHHPRQEITATADVSLFGGTSTGADGFPAHLLEIYQRSVADTTLKTVAWGGMTTKEVSLDLDESLFTHGSNFLLFSNNTTDGLSKIFLDYITVRYGSELLWEETQFDFWAPANLAMVRFMVSQVNSDIAVWDITDIHSPAEQDVVLSGNRGYFERTLSSAGTERFIIYNKTETLDVTEVMKIEGQSFSTLRTSLSGTDHIIIAPEEFLTSAEKLKEHRGASIVVPLQAVYDQFSGGVTDPRAVRLFLKWVKENWTASSGSGFASYVLLFGDGDYDYRNITGSSTNFIPTFQSSFKGVTSADDRFAYLDGMTPEMAVGRLPAGSLYEADVMVDKIIGYESDPEIGLWRRRVTLIADDFARPNFGAMELSHTKNSEELAGRIPRALEVRKLYMEDYPEINDGSQYGVTKPGASEALFDILHEGTVLLNYIGHGSAYQWAQEGILSSARGDMASIQTGDRLPIWLAATCSWGRYDNVEGSAMSEEILRAPANGGVAVISTNGLITFSSNRSFILKLFGAFFPDTTVTDLSLGAIYSSIKDGSQGSEMFHLLGDPALKIALPSKSAEVTSVTPDTLTALQTGTYAGTVSGEAPGAGEGFVTVRDAPRQVTRHYELDNHVEDVSYTLPGNTLFRGRLSFSGGAFDGTFILPKDISTAAIGGRLSVYLYGQQGNDLWEGLGLKEGLIFKGGTENPTDQDGPLISFGLEGRTVETGDNIPENEDLIVTLSDPLGINVTDEIGHGIRLWTGEEEMDAMDLTDGFVYDEGSHTSGSVKFSLANALPGETTVTTEAWDNANNAARKNITFSVTSDEELKLTNVFNYPNPFKDKTQFGFEVNREVFAEIKIFTLAGELVTQLEPLESFYGYAHIDWDGRDHYGDLIANGIYLYQLKVTTADGEDKTTHIGKAAKYR
jgi:hypothetical protein